MSTQSKSCSTPEFPPLDWLGYGLDLTSVNPFDFASVVLAKTQVRIVDTSKDRRTQIISIGGIEYEIPRVVMASEDNSSQGFTRTFTDGAAALKALEDDPALAYHLLSVSTSDNSLFPLHRTLPKENQYYFLVNDHAVYSGSLRGYIDFIDERELLKHATKLTPFDPEDPRVVQAYIKFFNTVGSHLVSSTTFGARFQLQVWASNKHEEVNSNFVRDTTASVEGLNNSGEYENTIFSEPQYQNFDRLSQRIIRIIGGDQSLADAVVDSPDHSTFVQWMDSIAENIDVTTFTTIELWSLLRDAEDKKLRAISGDLQKAFEYISLLRREAPNDKRTWITFEMESDWGEFGILTPSVVIAGGDSDQLTLPCALPQPLSLGPPKLRWRSSDSSKHVIAIFELINDGEPINVYVASGSGFAKVSILGKDYETKGGIERYIYVPVS